MQNMKHILVTYRFLSLHTIIQRSPSLSLSLSRKERSFLLSPLSLPLFSVPFLQSYILYLFLHFCFSLSLAFPFSIPPTLPHSYDFNFSLHLCLSLFLSYPSPLVLSISVPFFHIFSTSLFLYTSLFLMFSISLRLSSISFLFLYL